MWNRRRGKPFGRFELQRYRTLALEVLEPRRLLAVVVGRHVFYNHSAFDGNDPAADLRDDAAVAPDKVALMPGQTATLANYTSYTRGINGLMVDIAGLADPAALRGEDFQFRAGNSDDPSTWATSAVPDGEDPKGVWDSDYRGVWHLSEARSTEPGNYQDSTGNANHGRLVDANGNTVPGEGVVQQGVHFAGDADYLNLGNDPSLDITGTFDTRSLSVADDPRSYEAWPSLAKDSSGNLYMTYRTTNTNTHTFSPNGKTVIRKSADQGTTWGPEITVSDEPGLDERGGGVLVFDDEGTETILVVYRTYSAQFEDRVYARKSIDRGATWSEPIPISPGRQRRAKGEPIELSNGKIIVPMYELRGNTYLAESSDGGETWTEYPLTTAAGDETSLVELKTEGQFSGGLYAVTRDNRNKRFYKTRSSDYGHTWSTSQVATEFPLVSGTFSATFLNLLRLSDDSILAAYTRNWPSKESAIYRSTDEGVTWDEGTVVVGSVSRSFYPALLEIDSTHLGLAWCTNDWDSDVYFNLLSYPLLPLSPQGILTLEAWIRRDKAGNYDGLLSRDAYAGDSYMLRVRNNGRAEFTSGGVRVSSDPRLDDTDWHHVAAVLSDVTAYLYVDGALAGSGIGGSVRSSFNDTLIAARWGGAGPANFAEGVIDEVRISSTARSRDWLAFQYANVKEADHELSWDPEAFDPASGAFYKTITIQDDNLSADLENFPFYVEIDADTEIGGRARADGYDLRFTLNDGITELKYQREYWSLSKGAASGHFWVKIPSIRASGGARIRCYYGSALTPRSVTVRPGQGQGGSDRVTLIWDDGAIEKQWLQVTVSANARTGLAEPDVFYFGNAVGESGNSTTDAKVNVFDMLAARDNPRSFLNPAPIDFSVDFNRDRRVNTYDMLVARDNPTHFLNPLKLITVPGAKTADWLYAFETIPTNRQRLAAVEQAAAGGRPRRDSLAWLTVVGP